MKLIPAESEAPLSSHAQAQQALDFTKLIIVLRKSIPWLLLLLAGCLTTGYLVYRYTKPLYESYSEIKLDQENQSNILNLPGTESQSSFNLMSSEIELITSRLFFNKIIESVQLSPQYFTYGQFLVDEKFRNPPFTVDCQLKNANLYNKNIDVTILDKERYQLAYSLDDKTVEEEHRFEIPVENEDLKLVVHLEPIWNPSMGHEFYFRINSHDALINYLETNLRVEPVNLDANIFRISFRDHNQSKAQALVSAIDTLYYKYSLEEKNRANHNKIEYLESQLIETEKKLDEYEKYFEDVTITNKTVSLDEDIKRTVTQINRLDSQKFKLQERLDDLNDLSQQLKSGRKISLPGPATEFPGHLVSLIDEMNLLINERERLGLSYRQNTYTYRARQKEIDLLQTDLLMQIEELRKEVKEDIRFLERQKQLLYRQLNLLPSKTTEYNKAKRFYSLYEEIYLSLMQSKNEFEIAIAGSTTKIKILTPATQPQKPIKPDALPIGGISLSVFFVLAFAFVGIRYLAHDKINLIGDIERHTQATILGVVPKDKLPDKGARIVVHKQPKSALSESLRSIRTNIDFMLPESKAKVYSITSTIGSEGKTFISTNLAALMAMAGKKVVVVDLDLRKAKVHLAFDHKPSDCGMSTLLINKHQLEECLINSEIDNLDFIPAGPVPPNPSELLLREEFDQLLDKLRQRYDHIILDTPPIGIVTDGLLAMSKADLPIYVFRAGYSKMDFIQNVNRLLTTGRYPNLSVILNAVAGKKSGYGYSYGDVYVDSSYYQE